MSEHSLSGLFSSLIGTPNKNSRLPMSSRPFALFVQSVNATSSKYEEEQLVKRELQTIKEKMSQSGVSLAERRDNLCRILYCHMLGYDVTWGQVHSITLASQGSLLEKKLGYLATYLMMDRDAEVVLLLTSTMVKDLHSSNILDNMAALTAASQLVSKINIPFILEYVLKMLKHPRELVRQKAVMCLHQFQLLAPELLEHNSEDLQRALYDKDPGVMAAAIHVVKYQILKKSKNYESIGQSLIDILTQVTDRKMSSAFEYHSIQLPWLQIQLLQCLTSLVSYHERLKQNLCVLVTNILQKLNVKENMGFAILYECICCIIVMKPDRPLLDVAAQHVGRLLRSSDPNLKYIGLKALIQLVQADPKYAMNYQTLIVDSLDSEEVNIQKKMYMLLYQIANTTNVEAVCSKLQTHFSMTTDKYWRSEIIVMMIDLVERFPITPEWQIQTLFLCIQQGDALIDATISGKILDFLKKEFVMKSEIQHPQVLVQKCVSCLLMTNITPPLILIASWALGELCAMLQKMPEDRVISLFTKHLCDPELPFSVKSRLVTTLQNLIMNQTVSHTTMAEQLAVLPLQQNLVIRQRLSLLLQVCQNKVLLEKYEAHSIDTTLSFLDDHISRCLEAGGSPYIPIHLRQQPTVSESNDVKLFHLSSTPEATGSTEGRVRSCSKTSSNRTVEDDEPGIKIGSVKKLWGRHGRLDEEIQPLENTLPQDKPVSSKSKEQSELETALFLGITNTDKPKRGSNIFEEEQGTSFTPELSNDAGWSNTFTNLTLQSKEQSINSPGITSLTENDIEIIRDEQSPSDNGGLDFDTTDMLDIEETTHCDGDDESSTKSSKYSCLNSTALDMHGDADFVTDHKIPDFGDSLESTADTFNDAISSLLEENSSFLNISVSSTDQTQFTVTHTKSDLYKIQQDNQVTHSKSDLYKMQQDNQHSFTHQGSSFSSTDKTTSENVSLVSQNVSHSIYDDSDD